MLVAQELDDHVQEVIAGFGFFAQKRTYPFSNMSTNPREVPVQQSVEPRWISTLPLLEIAKGP